MILNKIIRYLLVLAGLVSLTFMAAGCSTTQPAKAVSAVAPDIFGVGEELARQLIKNRRSSFGSGGKLVFTTLVDLDELHKTSKFGRTLSESLATTLFQRGYGVEEIRKLSGVLVKDDYGELILSRDAARLAKEHDCDVVVAGTYSLTPRTVIINVKFLDAASQEVISVAGMEMLRSDTVDYLLSESVGIVDSKLSAYEM